MSVASRNLFAALGSDDEGDVRPDVKEQVVKKESSTAAPRGGRGGERGAGRGAARGRGRGGSRSGYSNEDAFKERGEVLANREKGTEEARPRGRGRGGRGGGGGGRPGREYDRHSQTGRVDTQKATDQAWGPETSSWESAAPIAEADRKEEKKDSVEDAKAEAEATVDSTPKEAVKEPEEEDNTQTYIDYLASKMSNTFSIGEARKADQSEWEGKTALLKKARGVEETLFGETSSQKSKSSSSSKKTSAPKKVILEIEQRFTPIRSGRGSERGGRGGARGTGERGGRGRGEGAPRGRGRGEDRGRGRTTGGVSRGGRGTQAIDVADTNAFPALG